MPIKHIYFSNPKGFAVCIVSFLAIVACLYLYISDLSVAASTGDATTYTIEAIFKEIYEKLQ